ncbi:hypothetical protein K9N68_39875 (plasmid) [Kovacikia minuta CCNUW1]|uniref:hypothetical protein n=1 Tax=Kovacikia minuta TaxID=2931930 RepID=UPI001CCCE71A|nr:hypothetical protein [Kovacikia minuta]UBF30757.1 hypothetical protein K9N68_39875 [Kovacikia minuta CCNUW1]
MEQRFVTDWLNQERDNHARLLSQLKRELAEARRETRDRSNPASSGQPLPQAGAPVDNSPSDMTRSERVAGQSPILKRQIRYR